MSIRPIRLLIFDLDGTIANTLEDIAASINHTLVALGRNPITRDAVERNVGDGLETMLTRLLNGDAGLVSQATKIYSEHHRANLVVHTHLYPGVRETLEHFRAIPMAIITNKSRAFSEPIFRHLGIHQFFRTIIGADAGLPLKPAPDAVVKIMHDTGVSKELTAIVGDGTTDMRAGKAAGIITCAVTYGYRTEEELKKIGPDYMIRTFSELKNLFVPNRQ